MGCRTSEPPPAHAALVPRARVGVPRARARDAGLPRMRPRKQRRRRPDRPGRRSRLAGARRDAHGRAWTASRARASSSRRSTGCRSARTGATRC
jgi:hypothetical protein